MSSLFLKIEKYQTKIDMYLFSIDTLESDEGALSGKSIPRAIQSD